MHQAPVPISCCQIFCHLGNKCRGQGGVVWVRKQKIQPKRITKEDGKPYTNQADLFTLLLFFSLILYENSHVLIPLF